MEPSKSIINELPENPQDTHHQSIRITLTRLMTASIPLMKVSEIKVSKTHRSLLQQKKKQRKIQS